ncbi:MAG: SusD/RagB family nutrient-binding outer membrane lipoprotein [Bacteroides sp.]
MKKILLISALALGVGFASCDSYLDINESPNSPSAENIETGMLMPAIEMNIASSYGDFLRITGGYFSQIYSHYFGTSNYLDYSRFEMSATRSSGTYTQFMQRALYNLKTVMEMSAEDEQWGTYLAATIYRAFSYQVLIDCYGEIPYTEALDPDNLAPHYDDGQVVYEGVLAELDEALSHASSSSTVCTNFLYPGKTAASWIQFANALKLRMLMRMADVKDVTSAVGALIAENNFPTSDVKFANCWADEASHRSPLFAEDFAPGMQKNLVANQAIIGTMQVLDSDGNIEYQDPRLAAFFETNESGEYFGGISGTNFSTSGSIKAGKLCRPVASYDMPVYLITVAEVEYLKAEYYARTNDAAKAAECYAAAAEASFNSAGVSGADGFLAVYPYDNSNWKKSIGVAKWIALAGTNPFEAYCEVRRLNYPAFGTATGDQFYSDANDTYDVSAYVPGTLYTPIMCFAQVGAGKLLERYPYPESSTSRNSNAPSFPGYTTPIFWGK